MVPYFCCIASVWQNKSIAFCYFPPIFHMGKENKYLNQTGFFLQNLPRTNFTETKFNFMGVTHRIQLTYI